MAQHRWLPEPLATFSSAPSALGPNACEKLLPSLTWGSLDPKALFPCPRHEAWSPGAVQDPCPTSALLLLAPWKPPRWGCWRPPAPSPPPREVLLLALSSGACPQPQLARPASPNVWAVVLGARSGRQWQVGLVGPGGGV